MTAASAGQLAADVDLRIFSPSFGAAKSEFQADNGARFELTELSIEGELLALDWRQEDWRYLGLGTSVVVRYESADLSAATTQGGVSSGSGTLRQASYHFSALAPAVMVKLYPFPDQRPLEPFVELRFEVYALSQLALASPSVDRYRGVVQVGVRGLPNETGYFWGARLFGARRGFSGDLGGVAVPEGLIFGLQVDWIGLEL